MKTEKVEVLVVGAGQAGLAISEHLGANEIDHLVLEKSRIAERWRTGRWDSLVANGPAWHDRFPNMEFNDIDGDAFAPKEKVADYFVAYAKQISSPVRTGVEVFDARRNNGRPGFRVATSEGEVEAASIVVATGPFQKPIIPPVVPSDADIVQIHSHDYRNPDQLADGAIMVVGAGSSGTQIAEELMHSGRKVYLSVGPHDRPPRAYRGHDFCWWLGVLGKWEAAAMEPGKEHVTIAVSGANGGTTVDFRRLAAQGMTLVGMTQTYKGGVLTFANDLAGNIAAGDENYLSMLDEADAYAERNGLMLPADPDARVLGPDVECVSNPLHELDLAEAGVTTIIWATGFETDYSWLNVDAFDAAGKPVHERGVSSEPDVYFLGLPWLSRRGSSFIWGVWHDAKHIADQICTRRKYIAHHNNSLSKLGT